MSLMIHNRLKEKFTFCLCLWLIACFSVPAIANESKPHLLIFGDSLSAAYGMDLEQGWAHLLALELNNTVRVTNASMSGETSGGGLARLPITLDELKPDLVMLELGANDGLQGLSISAMRGNLEEMINLMRSKGVDIALVGISLPASYGPRYIDKFRATYTELAEKYQLPFIDFYREEFFLEPDFIQQDGLHPTAKTQGLVKDIVVDFLNTNKLIK